MAPRLWGNVLPTKPTFDQQILAIKAEARRRIIAIMTEDKQRNTLAAGLEATMTYGADPANWPPELQQRQAEAMTAWAEIERLRTRSDEIELMDPIPDDVSDDGLWAGTEISETTFVAGYGIDPEGPADVDA